MTDGIIQEVFRYWRHNRQKNAFNEKSNDSWLEQQLIQNIKQESQLSDVGTVIRLKKLIGDNE